MWRRLWSKLSFAIRRGGFDRELAEEMDFHREMLVRDEEARGRSRTMALLNARRRMGNTTLVAEQSRDAWIVAWLDTLVRDVRYSLRSVARFPAVSLVIVLTLALGIGANTAIFRVVDAVMLRPLPVSRPGELTVIRSGFSYPRFEAFRDANDVFSGTVASHTLRDVEISIGGRPLGRGMTELVTGNYFSVLGVEPILGRAITPDDDRVPGGGPVAVISYGLWQRAFGGARDAVGRQLRLHGGRLGNSGTSGFEPTPPQARPPDPVLTIVGVAPPAFFGESVGADVDVWTPITMQPALLPGRAWLTRRTAFWLKVMGRRRPGVSEEQASARIPALVRRIRLDEIGPAVSEDERRAIDRLRIEAEDGSRGFTELRRDFSQPLSILMTAVTLVLLIACLNVANLLLARATARRHEISVRLSLGASRARLIRQLLAESLLLAAAGGALGLLLATAGASVLIALVSSDTQQIALRLGADWRVLAFTVGVSLASGILFGLVPALRSTRRDLQTTLRESGRTASAGRGRPAQALVAVQIAVSLVLLVGAGLFLRTLYNLKSESVGYDPAGLIVVRVDPVGAGYLGEAIGREMVGLLHRLAAVPGVNAATFSENGLFSGTESQTTIAIDGFKPASEDDRTVAFDQVGPGYFTNVGIPLILGRDLTERDGPGAPPVAVVNAALARFYFANESPIGKRIGLDNLSLEIVGVARDVKDHDLRDNPRRRLYVSYLQPIDGITTANFEVRADRAASSVVPRLRGEVERFDPKLTIQNIGTAADLIDQHILTERLIAKLSMVFGAVALLLASIGLYGVMAYGVARRTSELGIRMALGARPSAVASMVLREILALAALGSAVGALAALGLGRFVAGLVFGVKAADPLTFGVAGSVLFAVALVAGYLPARRAARIDPAIALRHE